MAMNVINRLIGAIVELNTVVKIHKYERFHEGHHFILMVMEVHGTPSMIWIDSSRNVFVFSTIDDD
jgi:hypothetical protein